VVHAAAGGVVATVSANVVDDDAAVDVATLTEGPVIVEVGVVADVLALGSSLPHAPEPSTRMDINATRPIDRFMLWTLH